MYTVGGYLAARFSQTGLKHHFAVAGDFKLVLLDEVLWLTLMQAKEKQDDGHSQGNR